MESHETLPWHVGINWSKDGLIVHLHEQSFARIFADKPVEMTSDGQGIIGYLNITTYCSLVMFPIHHLY